jgi:hypothetical protein
MPGNLPTDTTVVFSVVNTPSGVTTAVDFVPQTIFNPGTYMFEYRVVALAGFTTGFFSIDSLEGDINLIFGGPSELKKNTTPMATTAIDCTKGEGASGVACPQTVTYPDVTDLIIDESFTVPGNGTVASVGDEVFATGIAGSVPEPPALWLLGASLVSLALLRAGSIRATRAASQPL